MRQSSSLCYGANPNNTIVGSQQGKKKMLLLYFFLYIYFYLFWASILQFNWTFRLFFFIRVYLSSLPDESADFAVCRAFVISLIRSVATCLTICDRQGLNWQPNEQLTRRTANERNQEKERSAPSLLLRRVCCCVYSHPSAVGWRRHACRVVYCQLLPTKRLMMRLQGARRMIFKLSFSSRVVVHKIHREMREMWRKKGIRKKQVGTRDN